MSAAAELRAAPPWHVAQWLNVAGPLDLADLRGRVVVLFAFQMLCPGCVEHAIPQAKRVFERFDPADVAVIGLHTVFEHHDAMTPVALAAFAHEYRLRFPIGIDQPDARGGVPVTMQRYAMRGTPTLVLVDRAGRLRMQELGHVPDLELGAALGALLHSAPA